MLSLSNWKKKLTPSVAVSVVILGSLIARIMYVLVPTRPSWDGSVYLGMATYIAHSGHSGLWEYFRPVLWPLILAPFSLSSPSFLEISVTVLLVLFSLVALYCIYRAGEKVSAFVGVVAALLLSFSTPFFAYSHTPMVEVIEVLAVAAALWLFVEGRIFWLGILIGLAFTARFPLGMLLPVAGLALIISETPNLWKSWDGFRSLVWKGVYLCLGFIIPAFIYFASNIYFYGNAFSVLSDASGMITGFLWLYQGDSMFYLNQIINHNLWVLWMLPGLLFAGLSCVREKGFGTQKGKAIIFSILSIVFFLIYFSIQPHKEFRYIIPVMPALALLAAYGFIGMFKSGKYIQYLAVILGAATLMWIGSNMFYFENDKLEVSQYHSFYTGLLGTSNATVISATPIIAPYSHMSLIPAYNTWEHFSAVYKKERSHAQYVAYDTCELHACTPGQETMCKAEESSVRAEIAQKEEVIFQKTAGSCTLVVARIKK